MVSNTCLCTYDETTFLQLQVSICSKKINMRKSICSKKINMRKSILMQCLTSPFGKKRTS